MKDSNNKQKHGETGSGLYWPGNGRRAQARSLQPQLWLAGLLTALLCGTFFLATGPAMVSAAGQYAAGGTYGQDQSVMSNGPAELTAGQSPGGPSAGQPKATAPAGAPNSGSPPAAAYASALTAAAADTTAPQIFNVIPADGALTGPTIDMSADFNDPEPSGGINPATAMMHVDNRHTFGCNITTSHISCQRTRLSTGTHKLEVFVCDNAYNCSSASSNFEVDATGPAITGNRPTGTINSTAVELGATFEDPGAGVNPVSLLVTMDGGDVGSSCARDAASMACPVEGLAEGAHDVSVTLSDNLGNISTKSWTFTVDTATIGIGALQPAAGSWQNVKRPQIGASLQTAPGAGILPDSEQLRIDGRDFSGAAQRSATSVSLQPDTDLDEGQHLVSIQVQDDKGHTGESSWYFNIDTVAPGIGATGPVGMTLAQPQISAAFSDAGSGVDPSSARLELDGINQTDNASSSSDGISLTPPAPLASGFHTVRLTVSDMAGNQASTSWQFSVISANSGGPGYQPPAPGRIVSNRYWYSYSYLSSAGTPAWLLTGFRVSPKAWYLPWFDARGNGPSDARGPDDAEPGTANGAGLQVVNRGAGEAVVTVLVAGVERWQGNIAEGASQLVSLPGASGGPVKIVCPTGQQLEAGWKSGTSAAVTVYALSEKELEPIAVLPWQGAPASRLVIANAGSVEASVDVYLGDPAAPDSLKGHYAISPSGMVDASIAGASGGPLRIVSRNLQPLIAGMQFGDAGHSSWLLATGYSHLRNRYGFDAPDGRMTADQPKAAGNVSAGGMPAGGSEIADDLLIGNPGNQEARITIDADGARLQDPDQPGNDFFTLAPGSLRTISMPGGTHTVLLQCSSCSFGNGIAAARRISQAGALFFLPPSP